MSERLATQGDVYMGNEQQATHINIAKIGELASGRGAIGVGLYPQNPEAQAQTNAETAGFIRPFSQANIAGCGDGRGLVRLGEITDASVLAAYVIPQILGGSYLGATKAAVAADAEIVRGAKSFNDAFMIVADRLAQMGEEDSAHEGCGAENTAESSAAQQIDQALLVKTVGLLLPSQDYSARFLQDIANNKQRKVQAGFYSDFTTAWRKDFIMSRFPQNYQILDVDPNHPTGGHIEDEVSVTTVEGYGFAKNDFNRETKRQIFNVTAPKMFQLAHMLGGSAEERTRIGYAFVDDTLHVGSGLACENMPITVQTAA